MVLSLAPSVFAATENGASVTFSNTTPNPGDTITALITIDAGADFSSALGYETDLYFDKEWLAVEKIEILGTEPPDVDTVEFANRTGSVRIQAPNNGEDEAYADNYVRNLNSGDLPEYV